MKNPPGGFEEWIKSFEPAVAEPVGTGFEGWPGWGVTAVCLGCGCLPCVCDEELEHEFDDWLSQ